MALMRYEPWSLLSQLQRDMNRLFDTRLSDAEPGSVGLLASDWAPAVDIREEEKQYIIHADVPGVNVNDIDITMENGLLTIKGQRSVEKKEETQHYQRMERVRGTFLRRFALPTLVDADKITAKCKDGVLEVIVPKAESAQPRRITVES